MKIDIDIDDIAPTIKPSLYDINRSFEHIKTDRYTGIKGEDEARMVLFTNFILGQKPVILMGSRASGKSNLISVVLAYAKNPIEISSSSEKAYSRNKKLNEASHFIIPEINKINDNTVEMLKDFGEGAKYNYTFLNNWKEAETITLEPKAFITSIADENKNIGGLGEELLSRLTTVRTDSSVEQNITVIEEKLKRAENPLYKRDISQEQIKELVGYVKSLPEITNYHFVYPVGETIRTAIPPIFTDSRRDTDKYLANTYGITLFHYYDRMTVMIEDNEYMIVTPADIWYNHRIYENILIESSLKCGKMEKEILEILKDNDEVTKTDAWGNKVRGLKASDVHGELLKRSYTPSVESVNKYCTNLMEIGYVIRNEEVKPYRFTLNPELKNEYKVSINWENVVKKCNESIREHHPEIADEYVKRYCSGDGLLVIDPFTGEEKNILDTIEEEEIVEEPKVDKVEDVQIDIDLDDPIGEEDKQDTLQEDIMKIMSDDAEHSLDELINVVGSDDVPDMIKYLIKLGDVFEVKPGTFRRLV